MGSEMCIRDRREGDAIRVILNGTTRDRLALFSNKGVLYVIKVYDVPASTGYGEPIQTLLNFQDGERVVAATLVTGEGAATNEKASLQTDEEGQGELFDSSNGNGEEPVADGPAYLLATAEGMGFRFRPNLEETTRNGRKVARLADNDEVVSIEPIEGGRVVCVSAEGRMLAFSTEDVSELTGAGRGVILVRLEDTDRLVGAVTTIPGKGVTVTNSDGNDREVSLKEIPLGQRAGKGQRVIKRMTLVSVRGPVVEEDKHNGRA